jgi:hypothetical protein
MLSIRAYVLSSKSTANALLNSETRINRQKNGKTNGDSIYQGFPTGVPREIVIEKKNTSFFNLAKINRSTEKYHSLLKRALTIIIGLLYLQLTNHANVP